MWFTHARTYQDNHTHITFNSHFRYLIEETKQAFQFFISGDFSQFTSFCRMHHKGYASYNLIFYNLIKYRLTPNYDVSHVIYYYIIFISALI